MAARRVDKVSLHLAVMAQMVGISVVLVLLADIQDTFQFPGYGLGLIAGSSFVTAFIGFVVFSKYADLGYAKRMLVWGLFGGIAALITAAFATGLWSFVIARAVLGFAEGLFVPAARRVVLDWDPETPGEVLGRILAASVAGFALGPVIGAGLASAFGLRVPFLVPAFVLLLTIPGIRRVQPSEAIRLGDGSERMATLLRNPMILGGIAFGLIEFAAIGLLDALWARVLVDNGASTLFVGATFTFMAIPLVVLSPRFGRVVDRRSALLVAAIGCVLVIPAMGVYAVATVPWVFAAAGFVHSAGSSALTPASTALVAEGSPPAMLARGQGLLEAAGFLGAAATALPAGWLYEEIGRGPLIWSVNALFLILAVLGFWLGRKRPSVTA